MAMLAEQYARHFRVTIACSAAIKAGDTEYGETADLSEKLMNHFASPENGPQRFQLIVGGATVGLMEAVRIGAERSPYYTLKNSGIVGLGILLNLNREEGVHPEVIWGQHYQSFYQRLKMFSLQSHAFIALPGGIGTLDEIFNILQERQVNHVEESYTILLHEFWRPVWNAVCRTLHDERFAKGLTPTMKEQDMHLVQFFSTANEAIEILQKQSYEPWLKTREGFTYKQKKDQSVNV